MPAVTIVVPIFNDEAWISDALTSCIQQTLEDIEIICVDDASADNSAAIVKEFQARDPRIRLIHKSKNQSAFRARRDGIAQARSPFVLFLDGDDALAPRAAELASNMAIRSGADVVGFGVDVVTDDGQKAPRFARSLQPVYDELYGPEIVPSLFPVGKPAQGHVWRYLFGTHLVRAAYEGLDEDLEFYRTNDLPLAFLALAHATKYVSTKEHLYRYSFRRGTSGQRVQDLDVFRFYLSGVDSVESIANSVDALSDSEDSPLVESFRNARLSIIGNLLLYCVQKASPEIQGRCLALLEERVGSADAIRAAAWFFPDALPLMAENTVKEPSLQRKVQNVLITTGNLRTGGVQGVVAAQAQYLVDAGFRVTVAVFSTEPAVYELPEGVTLVRLDGPERGKRVDSWLDVCRRYSVDAVIDHHLLYNNYWPFLVLASHALNIPTFGWLHNFALRPIFDLDTRSQFLMRYLPLLQQVVVLSAVDVAYWKLLGLSHVAYLPNPPSPLIANGATQSVLRSLPEEGPVKLVWWGRLQQATKQVDELVRLAGALRDLGVDFHLTIIGPDSQDRTAAELAAQAEALGVVSEVSIDGPLHGEALLQAVADAHVFVSTSLIEGYPLALVEAQSLGLPVVMYELPWLEILADNGGISMVEQGHLFDLAQRIAEIVKHPTEYTALSEGSVRASRRIEQLDFPNLYQRLLRGELPSEYSPEPTTRDTRILLQWAVRYSERSAWMVTQAEQRRERELKQVRGEYDAVCKREARLKRQLAAIRGSASFRIGRALTLLPRRLRHLITRL